MLLSLAKLFTDQVVPSGGVSGSMLIVSALRRHGTSTPAATATVLIAFVAYYLAYAVALAVTLGILWGDLSVAVLALAAVLFVLAVGITLAIRWLARRGSRPQPRVARDPVEALREAEPNQVILFSPRMWGLLPPAARADRRAVEV